MAKQIIKRQSFAQGVHLRENADGTPSRTIEGYAVVFGVPSVPLYDYDDETLREVIAPEAVTRELLDASDIKLTMFHNREIILGRSKNGTGTLSYEVDDHGVKFRCELPDTANGNEALSAVSRGDISGCSFMFSCAYSDPQCVSVERQVSAEGKVEITATVRSIRKIHDFTLAADPAYEQTEVSLREAVRREEPSASEVSEISENSENSEHSENSENSESVEQRENTNTNHENMEETVTATTTPTPTVFAHVREHYGRDLARLEIPVITREDAATTTPTDNTITSAHAIDGGLMPVHFKGILDPLNQATVFDKIGMPLSYSNSGKFVWGTYEGGEASFVGEGEPVVAQKLDVSKIEAEPKRISVHYDLTRESINQSAGAIETIVRKNIAKALSRLVNRVVCSPVHLKGVPDAIKSPFEGLTAVTLSKNPTFKEINSMKAKLLAKGVDLSGCVYIVSAATYTNLEATPKDAGSGIMVLVDGKMCGLPVFISDDITDGYIGLGDYSNKPSGFFGDISLIVDPYTMAHENKIRFILNTGFASATVRSEAFALGKISAS